ncbi:MAG: HU family DNA-binding protein [Deltaproteobacteria bacterium]|nr:HU family DNA-binding protein [Deltaproteobacteria bacterium]
MTPIESAGLTRAEIVQILRESLSISGRDAQNILEGFLEVIGHGLEGGAKVSLSGLGTFQARQTPSRPGRNPKTGHPAKVPAKNRPSFSMSRELRTAMAERFAGPQAAMAGQTGNCPFGQRAGSQGPSGRDPHEL